MKHERTLKSELAGDPVPDNHHSQTEAPNSCLHVAPERKRRSQRVNTSWSPSRPSHGDGAVTARAPRLTADDERTLAARIKAGDSSAYQQLIMANLPLVLSTVREFRHPGVPLDDLIQEGNLGLIKAAQRYDPTMRSTRFATYASCWIRAYLIRAVTANASLSPDTDRSPLLRLRYRRATTDVLSGRAAEGEGSDRKPAGLEVISKHLDAACDRVHRTRPTRDERIYRETRAELFVAQGESPDRDLTKEEDRSHVHSALRRLSPFEAWVIRERFGLGEPAAGRLARRPTTGGACDRSVEPCDSEAAKSETAPESQPILSSPRRVLFQRSYVELSEDCGLSVHRVQQVERVALAKLRGILVQVSHIPQT
jgi:RNA polymerase primary sigma factor